MAEATALDHGDEQALDRLERRVREKRDDVDRYLASASRQRSRLVQITIIAGSVAAALTAAPALGGKPVSDWLNVAFGLSPETAPAWRLICLAAMICSLAATIATQLHKSHNYDEYITRAQNVRAALEALDVGIAAGHFSRREATNQYVKSIENASFITGRADYRPDPHSRRW